MSNCIELSSNVIEGYSVRNIVDDISSKILKDLSSKISDIYKLHSEQDKTEFILSLYSIFKNVYNDESLDFFGEGAKKEIELFFNVIKNKNTGNEEKIDKVRNFINTALITVIKSLVISNGIKNGLFIVRNNIVNLNVSKRITNETKKDIEKKISNIYDFFLDEDKNLNLNNLEYIFSINKNSYEWTIEKSADFYNVKDSEGNELSPFFNYNTISFFNAIVSTIKSNDLKEINRKKFRYSYTGPGSSNSSNSAGIMLSDKDIEELVRQYNDKMKYVGKYADQEATVAVDIGKGVQVSINEDTFNKSLSTLTQSLLRVAEKSNQIGFTQFKDILDAALQINTNATQYQFILHNVSNLKRIHKSLTSIANTLDKKIDLQEFEFSIEEEQIKSIRNSITQTIMDIDIIVGWDQKFAEKLRDKFSEFEKYLVSLYNNGSLKFNLKTAFSFLDTLGVLYASDKVKYSKEALDAYTYIIENIISNLDRILSDRGDLGEQIKTYIQLVDIYNVFKANVESIASSINKRIDNKLPNKDIDDTVLFEIKDEDLNKLIREINSVPEIKEKLFAELIIKYRLLSNMIKTKLSLAGETSRMSLFRTINEYNNIFSNITDITTYDLNMLSFGNTNNPFIQQLDASKLTIMNDYRRKNDEEIRELETKSKEYEEKLGKEKAKKVLSKMFERKAGKLTGYFINKYYPEKLINAENKFRTSNYKATYFHNFYEVFKSNTPYIDLINNDNNSEYYKKFFNSEEGILSTIFNNLILQVSNAKESEIRDIILKSGIYEIIDEYIDKLEKFQINEYNETISLFDPRYIEFLRGVLNNHINDLEAYLLTNLSSIKHTSNKGYYKDFLYKSFIAVFDRYDIMRFSYVFNETYIEFYGELVKLNKSKGLDRNENIKGYFEKMKEFNKVYKYFKGFDHQEIFLNNKSDNYSSEYNELLSIGETEEEKKIIAEYFDYLHELVVKTNKELGLENGYSKFTKKYFTSEARKSKSEKGLTQSLKDIFEDTVFDTSSINDSIIVEGLNLMSIHSRNTMLVLPESERSNDVIKTIATFISQKNKILFYESVAAMMKSSIDLIEYGKLDESNHYSSLKNIAEKIKDNLLSLQGKFRKSIFKDVQLPKEKIEEINREVSLEVDYKTNLGNFIVNLHDKLLKEIEKTLISNVSLDNLLDESYYSISEFTSLFNRKSIDDKDKYKIYNAIRETVVDTLNKTLENSSPHFRALMWFYLNQFNPTLDSLYKSFNPNYKDNHIYPSFASFLGIKVPDFTDIEKVMTEQLFLHDPPHKEFIEEILKFEVSDDIFDISLIGKLFMDSFYDIRYVEAYERMKLKNSLFEQAKRRESKFFTFESFVDTITKLTSKTYLTLNTTSMIAEMGFSYVSLSMLPFFDKNFSVFDVQKNIARAYGAVFKSNTTQEDKKMNTFYNMIDRYYGLYSLDTKTSLYKDLMSIKKTDSQIEYGQKFVDFTSSISNSIFKRAMILIIAERLNIKVKDKEGNEIVIRFIDAIDENGNMLYDISSEQITKFIKSYEYYSTKILYYQNDYTRIGKYKITKALLLFKSFLVNLLNAYIAKDGYNYFTDEYERGILISLYGKQSVLFNEDSRLRDTSEIFSILFNVLFKNNEDRLMHDSDKRNIRRLFVQGFLLISLVIMLKVLSADLYDDDEVYLGVDEDGTPVYGNRRRVKKEKKKSKKRVIGESNQKWRFDYYLHNLIKRLQSDYSIFYNPIHTGNSFLDISLPQLKYLSDIAYCMEHLITQERQTTGMYTGEYKWKKHFYNIMPGYRSYKVTERLGTQLYGYNFSR